MIRSSFFRTLSLAGLMTATTVVFVGCGATNSTTTTDSATVQTTTPATTTTTKAAVNEAVEETTDTTAVTLATETDTVTESADTTLDTTATIETTTPDTTTIETEVVTETTTTTAPSVKSFSLTARKFEFEPSTITVNQGDTVKLTITSEDVAHGFSLAEFGVSEQLSPGKTVNVEFTADKTGTFSFFCSVFCGSGHGSMKGTLVVQ